MDDHLFSFEMDGKIHCLTITATSEEDARRKVEAASKSMNYDGVLTYASDLSLDLLAFDAPGPAN